MKEIMYGARKYLNRPKGVMNVVSSWFLVQWTLIPLHIKLVYSIIGVLSNAESEYDLIFLILVSADSKRCCNQQ